MGIIEGAWRWKGGRDQNGRAYTLVKEALLQIFIQQSTQSYMSYDEQKRAVMASSRRTKNVVMKRWPSVSAGLDDNQFLYYLKQNHPWQPFEWVTAGDASNKEMPASSIKRFEENQSDGRYDHQRGCRG